KILLIIVQIHPTEGEFLCRCFVVIVLKIKTGLVRLPAKRFQPWPRQAVSGKNKVEIIATTMAEREGERRSAGQNEARQRGLVFEIIPHSFSCLWQQGQIPSRYGRGCVRPV